MNKHSPKFTLLLLLAFIAACQAPFKTDDDKSDDPITTQDSLGPSGITRAIQQDKQGNIWIASWEGIFKYDGNYFTHITSEVSLSRFFSVLADSKGTFWFGSIGSGAYYYDGNSFRNYISNDGLANDSVHFIYEAKSGHVWFATQGGVSFYDGTSFHSFTTQDGLADNDVIAVAEDNNGIIWIGTNAGISLYDGITFTDFTTEQGLSFQNVRSIITDMNGDVWIGGQRGLWRYDGITLSNISTQFVGYIYEDNQGNIWASSVGALGWEVIRYDKNPLFQASLTATKIWASGDMVFGISKDSTGMLWFGTLHGVCQYDGMTVNCLNRD